MRELQGSFRLLILSLVIVSISSCSSSSGIDDYFTFNLDKSFTLSAPANAAVWPPATIPLVFMADSADLSGKGTSLELVKSVKLTKLVFTTNSSTFPFSSVDTLILSSADSAGTQLIANYSGAVDSMYLSNADIARFIKNPKATFNATFGYKKAPATSVLITGNYTLVYTARPLQ